MRRSASPPPADVDPVRQQVRQAAGRLELAGVPSPWPDAVTLAREALARTDGGLFETADTPSAAFTQMFQEWVARRAMREPLQHVIGHTWFGGVRIETAPGVFIPRPETELLAAEAAAAAAEVGPAVVVDLCTGSGAIAAAIAARVPSARIWAVDVDAAAAALATRNAPPHGVHVVLEDAASALAELDGTVDVVASNPPYIPPDAVPREREVLDWDPPRALYGGGADGLDVPRAVVIAAARLLRPGGLFLMEHADVQGAAVRELVERTGAFTMVETRRDLADRERYVVARREDA